MLKKVLLGVLFLPALVVAQQQGPVRVEKPVLCTSTEIVMSEITKNYKEVPIWGSQLGDSNISLFVNPDTKTWTLIQWNSDFACVIDTGQDYFLKWPGRGV